MPVLLPARAALCARFFAWAWHDGVFHERGTLEAGGRRITVSRPCVLILEKTDEGWSVAVGDPYERNGSVRLSVDDAEAVLALPAGAFRGATVHGQMLPPRRP